MRTKGLGIRLSLAAFLVLSPATIPSAYAQDCVRVVRSISNFTIQGDAWLWWSRAEGQYARDTAPTAGSVLVFKRTGRLGRGHVSLVSAVLDRRTIEVDHSWITRGLRRGMRVVDVSPNNDWSAVRVWHQGIDQLGQQVYPTYGFILPNGAKPRHLDPEPRTVIAPPGRSAPPAATRLVTAARTPAPAHVVKPGHKPGYASSSTTYAMQIVPDTVVPSRKPSRGVMVAAEDGKPCPLPGRKPGLVQVAAAKSE